MSRSICEKFEKKFRKSVTGCDIKATKCDKKIIEKSLLEPILWMFYGWYFDLNSEPQVAVVVNAVWDVSLSSVLVNTEPCQPFRDYNKIIFKFSIQFLS